MTAGRKIGRAHLEAHILQSKSVRIARIEAVRRNRAQLEILAENLGNIAPRGLLRRAAAAEGEMDVIEGDILKHRIVDRVQNDRGMDLRPACDPRLMCLQRVPRGGLVVTVALDIAEGDVAHHHRRQHIRQCLHRSPGAVPCPR